MQCKVPRYSNLTIIFFIKNRWNTKTKGSKAWTKSSKASRLSNCMDGSPALKNKLVTFGTRNWVFWKKWPICQQVNILIFGNVLLWSSVQSQTSPDQCSAVYDRSRIFDVSPEPKFSFKKIKPQASSTDVAKIFQIGLHSLLVALNMAHLVWNGWNPPKINPLDRCDFTNFSKFWSKFLQVHLISVSDHCLTFKFCHCSRHK